MIHNNMSLTHFEIIQNSKNWLSQIIADDKKTWAEKVSQEIFGESKMVNASSTIWTIEDGVLIQSQEESNTNVADTRLSYEVYS